MTVDGVITVVDGPAVAAGRFADDPEAVAKQREEDESLDHDNPLEEVYEDQLDSADLVVLNKIDLLDDATLAEVEEALAGRQRRVRVIRAREGRSIPPSCWVCRLLPKTIWPPARLTTMAQTSTSTTILRVLSYR